MADFYEKIIYIDAPLHLAQLLRDSVRPIRIREDFDMASVCWDMQHLKHLASQEIAEAKKVQAKDYLLPLCRMKIFNDAAYKAFEKQKATYIKKLEKVERRATQIIDLMKNPAHIEGVVEGDRFRDMVRDFPDVAGYFMNEGKVFAINENPQNVWNVENARERFKTAALEQGLVKDLNISRARTNTGSLEKFTASLSA